MTTTIIAADTDNYDERLPLHVCELTAAQAGKLASVLTADGWDRRYPFLDPAGYFACDELALKVIGS